jgi:hypothetical protein
LNPGASNVGHSSVGHLPNELAYRRALLWLLLMAWLPRVLLAWQGGQYYWPDEYRFLRVPQVGLAFMRGDVPLAWATLFDPAHIGFHLISLVPNCLQAAVLISQGIPLAAPGFISTAGLSAQLLLTFSLASIALTYAIAQASGANPREAWLAAFLAACSSELFYFARHLQPYDSTMALALLASWLAFRENGSPWRSIGCGLVAGLAFLVYNGYWILSLVPIALLWWTSRSPARAVVRTCCFGLGFAAWLALLEATCHLATGQSYLGKMRSFSLTVTQGDLGEGWQLPATVLWEAEGAFGGLLVAAALLSFLLGMVRRSKRGIAWPLLALGVYCLLGIGAQLGAFVVYGRLVRQVVPFLCLAGAFLLERLLAGRPLLMRACLVVLAALAGLNYAKPLRLHFPREVERAVIARFGPVQRQSVIVGPLTQRLPAGEASDYVLLNCQHLWPVRGTVAAPHGHEILRMRHPLEFRPYQYEGFTEAERSLLRSVDISIRLIERAGNGIERSAPDGGH